jgi:stress-induced morphogen
MDLVEEVENRLKANFKHADLTIDFSDGHHMFLEIISSDFEGMSLIEQHRKVYAALQDLLDQEYLHALKLKTKVK